MEENNTPNVTNLNNIVTDNTVVGVENTTPNYTQMYNEVANAQYNNYNVVTGNGPELNQVTENVTPVQENTTPVQSTVIPTPETEPVTNNITIGDSQQMAQADVVQTTVTTIPQNLTQSPAQEIIQPVLQTPQVNNTVVTTTPVEETKPVEPVVMNKHQLKTETLREMVNIAKKAAICENLMVTTTVMELIFSPDSFKIITTDGANVLIQEDKTVKFTNELKLCVSADLFTKLLNKIETEYVELQYNEQDRKISLIADGEFTFSEIFDQNTFQPIVINTTPAEILPTDTSVNFNIDTYKDIIAKARTLSGNPTVFNSLSGVYSSDKICSSDKSNIFGAPNIPELVNETFYMSEKFVDLLLESNISGNVTMALRKGADGAVTNIIIKTDSTVLSGPVHLDQSKFPIQKMSPYFTKTFDNEFTFNKTKLVNMLERCALFLDPNKDKDSCEFSIQGNSMTVKSFNIASKQDIAIEGNNIPQDFEFNLNIPSVIKALKNCDDEMVTMHVDVENKVNVAITFGDIVEILSIINNK